MPQLDRRTFLKRAAAGVSAVIALLVAVPGVAYVLAPLMRSRREHDYLRVMPLSGLPEGVPVRAAITAERTDAWTHHPPGPIGGVFLVRDADPDGEPRVRCLQVICPHLGCAINYRTDRQAFACPCHASDFDMSGARRAGPAPRDMDPLPCRISAPDNAGVRWVEVRYQEFQTGIAERKQAT